MWGAGGCAACARGQGWHVRLTLLLHLLLTSPWVQVMMLCLKCVLYFWSPGSCVLCQRCALGLLYNNANCERQLCRIKLFACAC